MGKQEFFKIISVARDDLKEQGFDTSGVTDEVMLRLARKMASAYIKNSFWIDLDTIAKNLEVPRK